MRVFAHLQAIGGDEVDPNAEAWATTRMPGPLRGAFGKLPTHGLQDTTESCTRPLCPEYGTLEPRRISGSGAPSSIQRTL